MPEGLLDDLVCELRDLERPCDSGQDAADVKGYFDRVCWPSAVFTFPTRGQECPRHLETVDRPALSVAPALCIAYVVLCPPRGTSPSPAPCLFSARSSPGERISRTRN